MFALHLLLQSKVFALNIPASAPSPQSHFRVLAGIGNKICPIASTPAMDDCDDVSWSGMHRLVSVLGSPPLALELWTPRMCTEQPSVQCRQRGPISECPQLQATRSVSPRMRAPAMDDCDDASGCGMPGHFNLVTERVDDKFPMPRNFQVDSSCSTSPRASPSPDTKVRPIPHML